MGIRYVEVMLNADTAVLDVWKGTYGLHKVAVIEDNFWDMIPAGVNSIGTPWKTVVDPRTMEVIAQSSAATEAVLQKTQAALEAAAQQPGRTGRRPPAPARTPG